MNATGKVTDADRLGGLLASQRAAFLREGAPSLVQRRADLTKFRAAIIGHRKAIEDAINADFGHRSRYETAIMEVAGVAEGTKYLIRKLRKFMKPTRRHVALHMRIGNARIQYQPLGVVGVMSPWNYPVNLALMPVVTAIAAGNRVMLKPSEFTPVTNSLLAKTGGGTGLGKAMAAKFLSLGADIHICGRRKGVCEETAAELMKLHGGKVTAHGVDIRDAAAVDAMIDSAFKDRPLTDLINNAAGNFISRTQDLTPRGFDAIANIVMHGTFYVTHAVGKRWIAGGHRGNVVSITVTWVRNGSPYVVPSTMSKSAIHAMTMSLATEWGRYGNRLNTIAPGEIPTEGMSKRIKPGDEAGARTVAANPMGRVGEMSELQNLATFLISGGCDWINGETIVMDGAQALAMGGNFYEVRDWKDSDWAAARDAIMAQNEKDKAKRG